MATPPKIPWLLRIFSFQMMSLILFSVSVIISFLEGTIHFYFLLSGCYIIVIHWAIKLFSQLLELLHSYVLHTIILHDLLLYMLLMSALKDKAL